MKALYRLAVAHANLKNPYEAPLRYSTLHLETCRCSNRQFLVSFKRSMEAFLLRGILNEAPPTLLQVMPWSWKSIRVIPAKGGPLRGQATPRARVSVETRFGASSRLPLEGAAVPQAMPRAGARQHCKRG